MPLRIAIDTSTALAGVVGEGVGFSRLHLQNQLGRFKGIHGDLESAITDGLLPHIDVWLDEEGAIRAQARASAWQQSAGRVVVLGTPDAVAAARVLSLLAAPGTGRSRNIRWISSTDPSVVQSAFHPRDGNWLVVLDGPDWVRRMAVGLMDRVVGTTIFVGDGTPEDQWTLPGAELVVDAGSADPRFGIMGAAALTLMAVAGNDPKAAQEGVSGAMKACRRTGLFDNPAYRLAALLNTASETLLLDQVVCMLCTPQLQHWAEWLCNAWSAITTFVDDQGSFQVRAGHRPRWIDLANESALERQVSGPANHLTLAFWVDDPGQDVAIGELDTAWLMARELMNQQIHQLVTAGRPVIQVRIPTLAPDAMAELSVLFLHGLLAMVAGRGGDPLAMNAADAFRRMHEVD